MRGVKKRTRTNQMMNPTAMIVQPTLRRLHESDGEVREYVGRANPVPSVVFDDRRARAGEDLPIAPWRVFGDGNAGITPDIADRRVALRCKRRDQSWNAH